MVQQTERLVLLNVHPELPNAILEKKYAHYFHGSDPYPLGLKNKDVSRAMSFRLQVHVIAQMNVINLDRMNITYSGIRCKWVNLGKKSH